MKSEDYKHLGIDMSDIEIAIHSAKLNYERLSSVLNKLIYTERLLEKKDTINVYIDVFSVLNGLYREINENSLKTINTYDRYMLVSEIINIVGHYRHYFFNRLGLYSNIILFYTNKESSYCKNINPEYKERYYNKYFRNSNDDKTSNKIIMNTLDYVKEFLRFIPHAYLINTGEVEPRGFVRYMVDNCLDNEYNLILTNDQLYYDMLGYRTDISILHLKGEHSINIYRGNIYDYLTRKLKKEIEFPSNYLVPIVFSYMNHLSENIKYGSKTGISNGLKKVNKLLEEKVISDNIEYTPDLIEILVKDVKLSNNYKLISSKNLANNITDANMVYLNNQFIDNSNIQSVKAVCNNYFKKNEVILSFLFDGEEVK